MNRLEIEELLIGLKGRVSEGLIQRLRKLWREASPLLTASATPEELKQGVQRSLNWFADFKRLQRELYEEFSLAVRDLVCRRASVELTSDEWRDKLKPWMEFTSDKLEETLQRIIRE